ncbi:MAG: bifunctional cobalt-precorrin-7 (C(5))-methyltransferase/cobalt-precorrin-6B (C(15))-methyltransferase [Desulfobulbus propionicus]|nr:MAG: bifunctional cobalt-precorrin-7 (C(5))-methyltransferase/cobalt-precorrin-6B (C(15))-methyltransferase [Desulfobulbus propionicus]
MNRIQLIGIEGEQLQGWQKEMVCASVLVVASRRYRLLVDNLGTAVVAIAPLAGMLEQLADGLQKGDVAVLASGDPLLYGIGRLLLKRFGPDRVRVYPAVSAVQLACSRFALPWDDLPLVSLHGRALENPGKLLCYPRVLLFTDETNSPDRVAEVLQKLLLRVGDTARCRAIGVRVAENLGLSDERLVSGTLAEIADQRFAPLNMMLLEQPEVDGSPAAGPFGLREADIHHSRGLITKDEVRAAILHQLKLPHVGTFWDIGGGSGAVSLEAARLCPDLNIYTVERRAEQLDNIHANIRRYAAFSIQTVDGEAPTALDRLPDPHRVFIGGSGGNLEGIITTVLDRLNPGGRVVVSAILKATAALAPVLLHAGGCRVSVRTVQVERWSWPEKELIRLNPITIITGER